MVMILLLPVQLSQLHFSWFLLSLLLFLLPWLWCMILMLLTVQLSQLHFLGDFYFYFHLYFYFLKLLKLLLLLLLLPWLWRWWWCCPCNCHSCWWIFGWGLIISAVNIPDHNIRGLLPCNYHQIWNPCWLLRMLHTRNKKVQTLFQALMFIIWIMTQFICEVVSG